MCAETPGNPDTQDNGISMMPFIVRAAVAGDSVSRASRLRGQAPLQAAPNQTSRGEDLP